MISSDPYRSKVLGYADTMLQIGCIVTTWVHYGPLLSLVRSCYWIRQTAVRCCEEINEEFEVEEVERVEKEKEIEEFPELNDIEMEKAPNSPIAAL